MLLVFPKILEEAKSITSDKHSSLLFWILSVEVTNFIKQKEI
jgi:hypothetical protein